MNAKEEFLEHIENRKIKCVLIQVCYSYEDTESIKLKCSYSNDDYLKFLELLDFDYDNGYGLQELYGTIWYEDGTFSERGEYDGSEWWKYMSVPEIPDCLINEVE